MDAIALAVTVGFAFAVVYAGIRLLWDEDMPNLIG